MAGKSPPSGEMQSRREAPPGLGREGPRLRAGAAAAAAVVAAAAGRREVCEPGLPRLGVVLGTGLGGLADRLDDAWSMPARDTGWLVPSTATGHVDEVQRTTSRRDVRW